MTLKLHDAHCVNGEHMLIIKTVKRATLAHSITLKLLLFESLERMGNPMKMGLAVVHKRSVNSCKPRERSLTDSTVQVGMIVV